MFNAFWCNPVRKTALVLGVSVLVGAVAAPAFAQQTQPGATPPARTAPSGAVNAKDFVTKAAVGSMYEIEAAKLASDRAQRADVKQFAQRIVKDHSAADKDLKDALSKSKAGVQPPTSLDAEARQKLEKLKGAQGASFDTLYVDMMKDDHEDDIELFQTYSRSGDDPALKAFAEKTLPVLRAHAAEVAKLEKK